MAKLTTESVADILMTLKNGPCNNTELLHQYIFYEKNGSKVLNIKLVGPGLTALSAMSSPMDDIFLQETGNTLVFGDKWYGWDNVQDIQNIAKQYITDYKIEKLNIIIHTHGVIKDGIYYLGLGYDPEGTMGAPQFINSNSITKELSELSQLVAVTHIISVACYGNNQTLDESFINFKNTTFYALLGPDVTWQGDLFNNNMSFTNFFEKFNINVMDQCLTEYFKSVNTKKAIPYVTKIDKHKITPVGFPKLSINDISTLDKNIFLQELIKQSVIELSVSEIQKLLIKSLIDSDDYMEDIKTTNPALFGTVLGISYYNNYQMTNDDNLPEPCNLIGENDGME